MKSKQFISVVLFLFAFSFCKKKDAAPPVENVVKNDTVYTNSSTTIDPSLKPYYSFKEGSYWIFKNLADNTIDSLYLVNYSNTVLTSRQVTGKKVKINTDEVVTYTLVSSKNSGSWSNLNYIIKNKLITAFKLLDPKYGYYPFLQYDSTFIALDSLTFNNNTYKKLKKGNSIYKTPDNKGTSYLMNLSECYWSADFGMVKCKSNELFKNIDLELLRCHVIRQ